MKINWNKLLSLTASESDYFEDQKDKIEFTGCKLSGKNCLNYLPVINDHFRESNFFYRDRDYNRAIDALEKAWQKATEIKELKCQQCALLFQATAVQSLEGIYNELKSMRRGLFGTRQYHSCQLKAELILKKLKPKNEIKPEYPLKNRDSALQPAYSL